MKLPKIFVVLAIVFVMAFVLSACAGDPNSDDAQRQQQEALLEQATDQTGMPNIVNFRERKLLKTILELRDQEGIVTYTYLENMVPTIVPGVTAMGGKLTFLGVSIGYGIPYSTQYTNPQRPATSNGYWREFSVPQADPNGLFSPEAAEGTWVILKNPTTGAEETAVVYVEPRIIVSPFQFPFDQ